MNMIHKFDCVLHIKPINLRSPCCLGDNLFSYNTKKGKNTKKNKMQNIKSWLTANTVKNHMILRCINSCRCIYKNTGSLLYIYIYAHTVTMQLLEL